MPVYTTLTLCDVNVRSNLDDKPKFSSARDLGLLPAPLAWAERV